MYGEGSVSLIALIKQAIGRIDSNAQIILYGSRARGTERADSDWDILILTDYPMDIAKERVFRNTLYDLELETGEPFSVFVYSNVSTDELYNVKFSLVGNNLGNYELSSSSAIGKIYRYIAPVNGIPQGNYEPIVKLIAPTELQIATVLGKFNPSEKTNFEVTLFRAVQSGRSRSIDHVIRKISGLIPEDVKKKPNLKRKNIVEKTIKTFIKVKEIG